ncbi:MAG: hypothetical protein U0531_08120 [Dehalococcoidia bacterium]
MHDDDSRRYLRVLERRATRLQGKLDRGDVRPFVYVALLRQQRPLRHNVVRARLEAAPASAGSAPIPFPVRQPADAAGGRRAA